VRLLTRNGIDWSARFPLIVQAVAALRARSCLIDGEAIAYDDDGVALFELLRGRRHDRLVALCAFDLLELDGRDLRRTPIEERKRVLARLIGKARAGVVLNITLEEPGDVVTSTPARSAPQVETPHSDHHNGSHGEGTVQARAQDDKESSNPGAAR
jgi:ATP-dependent DNA ligase